MSREGSLWQEMDSCPRAENGNGRKVLVWHLYQMCMVYDCEQARKNRFIVRWREIPEEWIAVAWDEVHAGDKSHTGDKPHTGDSPSVLAHSMDSPRVLASRDSPCVLASRDSPRVLGSWEIGRNPSWRDANPLGVVIVKDSNGDIRLRGWRQTNRKNGILYWMPTPEAPENYQEMRENAERNGL